MQSPFLKIEVVNLSATAATAGAEACHFDDLVSGGSAESKAANGSLSSIDAIGKLPAALDWGSLRVAIQSGGTPTITAGFATETTLAAQSAKITVGQDVKVPRTAMQQVLMCGRKSDSTYVATFGVQWRPSFGRCGRIGGKREGRHKLGPVQSTGVWLLST